MNLLSLILDIALVAIIILVIGTSAKRGFAVSIMEFIGTVVATIASAFLGSLVSTLIYNQFIKNSIINDVTLALRDIQGPNGISGSIFDRLPGYVQNCLNADGVDGSNLLDRVPSATNSETLPLAVEEYIRSIITSFITVIAMVIIFVILMVIVIAVSKKLGKVFKMPAKSNVYKVLGGVFGALKAMLFLMILTLFFDSLAMIMPTEAAMGFNTAVEQSLLFKFMYYINIPQLIISMIV